PLFRSWHSRGPPGGVVPALQEEEGPRPEGRLLLRQRRRTLDRPTARRGDGLLFGVHHVGRARHKVLLRASRAPPPLKHGRPAGGGFTGAPTSSVGPGTRQRTAVDLPRTRSGGRTRTGSAPSSHRRRYGPRLPAASEAD